MDRFLKVSKFGLSVSTKIACFKVVLICMPNEMCKAFVMIFCQSKAAFIRDYKRTVNRSSKMYFG